MALTYNSTSDKWSDNITITKQGGSKLTLATNDQYVNGDIEFNISVQQASGISITGGAPSGSVSTISGSNITLSDTNNGIAITASGNTSRAAITCSATTAGWVNTSIASADASSNVSLTPKTRYATAVVIPSGKTFAISGTGTANIASSTTLAALTNSGTITSLSNSGTITALENAGTITGLGNASGKTIATLTNKGTITTLNNTGTVTVKSTTTSGTVKVNAYPASGSTLDGEKTIVSGGRWQCTPTFNGAGTYYGKVTVSAGTITFTAGSITNTDADLSTQTNITASPSENNSGVAITCRGYAGCSSATYTNTAGWFTAHSSATNAGGAVAQTNWTGTTYYVNGVTLQAPSSSTRTFNLTVPNGNSTDITLTFTVDSSGNVVVT